MSAEPFPLSFSRVCFVATWLGEVRLIGIYFFRTILFENSWERRQAMKHDQQLQEQVKAEINFAQIGRASCRERV